MPDQPDRTRTRVAKRLNGLVVRVRDGQLTDRDVTYLDALLNHFHEVRTEWSNQ